MLWINNLRRNILQDNLDKYCSDLTDTNPNLMVPWYLMASYAYYEQDNPILSDAVFDRLGRRLLEMYDKVEHFHKHLITVDDLKAGTYLGEYPSRIKGAIEALRNATK